MVNAMFAMSCLSPRFSIYVRDILDSGAFLYGVVSSAVGVGLIAGTQTVSINWTQVGFSGSAA